MEIESLVLLATLTKSYLHFTVCLFYSQMTDFLEGEFLGEQVESIKQLSDYATMLRRVGPGLGEYQFDKETLQ